MSRSPDQLARDAERQARYMQECADEGKRPTQLAMAQVAMTLTRCSRALAAAAPSPADLHDENCDCGLTINLDTEGKRKPPRQAAPSPADQEEATCGGCGHSRKQHDWMGRWCEAMVYTDAPVGGGSCFPCDCREFVEPSA